MRRWTTTIKTINHEKEDKPKMTGTNTPTNPITRFCEEFNVKSDRLATEYVHCDEEHGIFLHSNAQTWGDSVRLSIEPNNTLGEEILSLEGYNEEELIAELSELYASVDFDKDAFTKAAQAKYENENEI